MQSLQDIADYLKTCKSVLVATHIQPDPDAVGSGAALTQGLLSIGIDTKFYLTCPMFYRMAPLVGTTPIIFHVPNYNFDAVVVVDCANLMRTGDESERLVGAGKRVICIDHHFSNESFGDYTYVEPERASSSEIVYDLLKMLRVTVSEEIANLLYAGLADDTGSFRYSNANNKAFESAARMVADGAKPHHVASSLYFSMPVEVLRLRARALSKLRFSLDGKVCVVTLTQKDFDETGASGDAADGIVDEARRAQGTYCAVFIRELDNKWKVSLRSKHDKLDVNAVAAVFGGGGHVMASGYKVKGTIEEVEAALLEQLKQAIDRIVV
uniref:Phosphoesterase domain-containing protein n=1 Tax=wastewater metagenome TaxID=527639 RepID=A0A0A8KWQ1_9ZZZZ